MPSAGYKTINVREDAYDRLRREKESRGIDWTSYLDSFLPQGSDPAEGTTNPANDEGSRKSEPTSQGATEDELDFYLENGAAVQEAKEASRLSEAVRREFKPELDEVRARLSALEDNGEALMMLLREMARSGITEEDMKALSETLEELGKRLRGYRAEVRVLLQGGPRTVGELLALQDAL
jgi:hypothetical protein